VATVHTVAPSAVCYHIALYRKGIDVMAKKYKPSPRGHYPGAKAALRGQVISDAGKQQTEMNKLWISLGARPRNAVRDVQILKERKAAKQATPLERLIT
jgi:hypothetical protein